MVRKLANFFDSSAKPETLSITKSRSRVVFYPKTSLSLKNSFLDEEVLSSFSFLLAVFKGALKTSNRSSNCSIDFG